MWVRESRANYFLLRPSHPTTSHLPLLTLLPPTPPFQLVRSSKFVFSTLTKLDLRPKKGQEPLRTLEVCVRACFV